MDNQSLVKALKSTLLIPDEVNTFDDLLTTFVLGAKTYVLGILDQKPDEDDELLKLTIIYLAQYYWLNRDNGNLKNLPVTVDSLLDRLKTKYMTND